MQEDHGNHRIGDVFVDLLNLGGGLNRLKSVSLLRARKYCPSIIDNASKVRIEIDSFRTYRRGACPSAYNSSGNPTRLAGAEMIA